MFQEIIDKKHFAFHQEIGSWEDAIRASCKPLEKDHTVDETYAEQIIDCIHKYGPYIVIAPMIAIPHSQENAKGVYQTAISFMKVERPVSFDPEDSEKDAKLFFTIASENPDQHLKNLTELSEILCNDEVITDLLDATTEEDLVNIKKKYNI